LPGIASTVSLNRPRSPAMLADRSAISIANSETAPVFPAGRPSWVKIGLGCPLTPQAGDR
jgi:hypothetical protein